MEVHSNVRIGSNFVLISANRIPIKIIAQGDIKGNTKDL